MNTKYLSTLATLAFLTGASMSQGASVLFDAIDTTALHNGADFDSNYGSDGFLFPVTTATSNGYGTAESFTNVDPFTGTFTVPPAPPATTDVTYSATNTLGSAITATSIDQNYVEAGGLAYGTLNGSSDFIGIAGATASHTGTTSSLNAFNLTFNLANAQGYQITFFTEVSGANNQGVDGITFTTTGLGADVATNSVVETNAGGGYIGAYTFDVSNISAGDTLTVSLSSPQTDFHTDSYTYFGLAVDPNLAPIIPEPSTVSSFALGLAGLAALFYRNRRKASMLN
jgi:hypothetical protein